MTSKFRERAFKWIEDQKKASQQKAKPQNREIVNGVDITDVPQHIRQTIKDLGRDSKSQNEPNEDLVGMVREYMKIHKCSAAMAYGKVNKILKRTPGPVKASAAQPTGSAYAGDLDPMDFPKIVKKYQREHKCTIGQAWKMIQEDHPGLQSAFIDAVNR